MNEIFIHPITLPHTQHLPDNMVLAIAGSAVGGALLLVVTIGVVLCALVMKLKLYSATNKSQSKLHDQLFIQHVSIYFMFPTYPISHLSSYHQIGLISADAYFRNWQAEWVLIFMGCLTFMMD